MSAAALPAATSAPPTPEQIQFADLAPVLAQQQSAQIRLTAVGVCGLAMLAATAYLIWRKK